MMTLVENQSFALESLEREKRELECDCDALRWLLEFSRRDKVRLIDNAHRAMIASARLSVLYAAVDRLHASVVRADVVEAIHDIVVNVIGAERTAIFEVHRGALEIDGLKPVATPDLVLNAISAVPVLSLIDSAGLLEPLVASIAIGEGIVGRTVESGCVFLRRDDQNRPGLPWEDELSACIPLRVNGRPIGAIAIMNLRDPKQDFAPIDIELFSVLATHAATALHASAV